MIRKALTLALFLLITPMVFVITGGCSENESAENLEIAQATDTDTPAVGGPKVHFAEPEHDFGSVSQGEKLTHTFIVTNVGDEPLKLIKAKAP